MVTRATQPIIQLRYNFDTMQRQQQRHNACKPPHYDTPIP